MKKQSTLYAIWVAGAAVVLACIVALIWVAHASGRSDVAQNSSEATGYGTVPTYTLVDQSGRKVHSSAFLGKVQVVSFLFPYCTSYCPLTAQHIVQVESALQRAGLADRVQFISFNVDPAGTGPKQMRAFMHEYGWPPSDTHWEYLTGSVAQIRRVVQQGYMVTYERESNAQEDREIARERKEGTYVPQPEVSNPLAKRANVDYDIVHNDLLEVVGPRGHIRAIYLEADTVTADNIIAITNTLDSGRP
ncbi:MAG TPA: SCO family protein [Candidatus Dormibacteraeota bacterium]|nr:SCO family protein [Candidatus Dormibacteraeota bacterium]